ncbi:acyltransferase family protein [Actinomycetospora cinnamomea]|uniref:acyltransferase family protein n=1 Tax=Actinomycetospora cinnamomea TaxID=663609 RepID=UPI001FAF27C5|nr:acyltransferase family protein [Actinomycetospora cinnamomea]
MTGAGATVGTHTPTARSARRPEIEGLRGLAAVLVVLYHVWVGRVSGGVDVFFLLSGFLVVGMLARTAIRGAAIDVVGTWTRLFWRLVPTAGLVLLASTIAAAVLLPPSTWSRNRHELLAAVGFVENWRLAADAVDYYASNGAASVAQHFWSLSIQAQCYLLAPLLVLLVAWWARARGADVRAALIAALSAVALASFTHSVLATASDQAFAYFDARTRIWEFALGGLLALVVDRFVLGRRTRAVLGWGGVAGLVTCGAVLDVGAAFPGYLALWPVLSAAAVIVAGRAGAGDRLLTTRTAQYLGRISYPLYLWHWPVLVVSLVLSGRAVAGAVDGLVVVVLALGLAVVTHHLVEEPLRQVSVHGRRLRAPVLVALPLLPALVALGVWSAAAAASTGPPVAVGDPDHPGAAILLQAHAPISEVAPVRPAIAQVQDDWAQYRDGCAPVEGHPVLEECVPVRAEGEPQRRVTVVGDSHMQQFLPALEPLARERGWEVRTLVRARCPFATTSESDPADSTCVEWNAAAIEHLAADPPDAVVTSATRDVRVGLTEQTPDGFVAAWQRLDGLGIPVLAVRDNPRYDHRPSECLERHGRGAPECEVPRGDLLAADPPYALRDDVPSGVAFLDLSNEICTPATCPPEIGNVLVYLDDNHLSASYSRTMSAAVRQQVPTLLGW